jgi:hypothetical protein
VAYPDGGEAGGLDLALELRELPIERRGAGGAHAHRLIRPLRNTMETRSDWGEGDRGREIWRRESRGRRTLRPSRWEEESEALEDDDAMAMARAARGRPPPSSTRGGDLSLLVPCRDDGSALVADLQAKDPLCL